MKKIEKLYCGADGQSCPAGYSCIDGNCVRDIVPGDEEPTEDNG